MSVDSEKPPKPTRRKRRSGDDLIADARLAARKERQAAYQREYRAAQNRAKIPSRDDVAGVAFHWFITLVIQERDHAKLMSIRKEVIRRLVELGFDPEGAEFRVDDLINRYEDGWKFQRKPHLRRDDPDDVAD